MSAPDEPSNAEVASPTTSTKTTHIVTRILRWALVLTVVMVALVAIAGAALHQSRPMTGVTGAAADAMARRIEAATGQDRWEQLGAIRWTFRDATTHLWDRDRGFVRVRWGEFDVLLRDDGTGIARRDGRTLGGEDAAAARDAAHSRFINDSYWLNPFSKLFDDGVTRSLITSSFGEALFVEFSSGGRTPGDGYAIYVDDAGRPNYWEMWVSIIPVGGIGCSWQEWQGVGANPESGLDAQAAAIHDFGLVGLELSDIQGAPSLESLLAGSGDPFGELQ